MWRLRNTKMKKIMTIFGAILFASVIFTSCGGEKKEISVKPSSTAVKGDLSDLFEVVDGAYQIEKKYYENKFDGIYLKVQIKKTNKEFDKNSEATLYCELLADNQSPIGSKLKIYSYELTEMINLKPNETAWVKFYINTIGINEEEVEKVKSFTLSSTLEKREESSSSSSVSSENESPSTESSVDCDKFIKDYTAFVDSYIKLLKKYKANPTDASILSEYTDAAQKAAEMQTDASSCTDPEYASKLMELANKIAKAAM